MRGRTGRIVAIATGTALIASVASAAGEPARAPRASPVGALSTVDGPDATGEATPSAAAASTPTKIALDHLRHLVGSTGERSGVRGLTGSDTAPVELVVDSTARSDHAGVTHVYVQQRLGGIDVVGATANVAVTDDGAIGHDPHQLLDIGDEQRADALGDDAATIDQTDAVIAGLALLGVPAPATVTALGRERGAERHQLIDAGSVLNRPAPVRLVRVPVGKDLVLGWAILAEITGGDLVEIVVAADDARELDRTVLTIHHRVDHDHDHAADRQLRRPPSSPSRGLDARAPVSAWSAPTIVLSSPADGSSYRVFELPIEAPSFGSATVVADPATDASPFGWHDTNGVAGAESTLTTGNNVDAYLDLDGDDTADGGSRVDGGSGLDFLATYDDSAAPTAGSNPSAEVTNLFYATNWAHDFFHAHGFDEASGNFQVDNYGNGGTGGDAVRAEGLDDYVNGTRNNANFATPPDGWSPRMQMYAFCTIDPITRSCDDSIPLRSSSFDNGVVLHEYAHGWSTRLTGGRNTATCLNNDEQMGEGWSDWAALMATIEPGDAGTDRRGIGTWAVGQGTSGRGIRAFPYSTDAGIDPRTYDDIASSSVPHGVGSIWAAMLWELTWLLVERHGLDADPFSTDGGDGIAMQLVTDGLKLQPCRPGFVDGRDAILAADRLANGGVHECLIWEAFASRGLGWSASQGSALSTTDGTEAFDLPPYCPLRVTLDGPSGEHEVGDVVTFTSTVEQLGRTAEGDVVVSHQLSGELAPIDGSVACDRSATAVVTTSTVEIELGVLAPADVVTCAFEATVVGVPGDIGAAVTAGFENGLAPFTSQSTAGSNQWEDVAAFARSGARAAWATNPSTLDETSDQQLVLVDDVTIEAGWTMEFWHRYSTEETYDGGVVELRVGSGPWRDLGSSMIEGGYDGRIATALTTNSPIAERDAFNGEQLGHRRTVVDLADHVGDEVTIRFRYTSDQTVPSEGWWIDDVRIGLLGVTTTATVTGSSGRTHAASSRDLLIAGSPPPSTVPPTTGEPPAPPTTSAPTSVPPRRLDTSVANDRLEPADRLAHSD